MEMGYCINCGKKKPVKKIGEYYLKGLVIDIGVCQWCRAAATRRKRAMLPEPFLIRKGDK